MSFLAAAHAIPAWASQAIAIVVGGVILSVPVWLWRWMEKHLARPLRDVPVIRKELVALSDRFRPIEEQFQLNHGHSLRDSNDRNEALTRAVAAQVGLDPETIAPEPGD